MKTVEMELKELILDKYGSLSGILIPNKKAPQNAKYSVLRGCVLPAAGVEPARSRMFIELFWNRVKFRVKKVEVALP